MVSTLGIIVSIVLGFIIGVLRYSPFVFGKIRQKSLKISESEMQKTMSKMKFLMLMQLISTCIIVISITILINVTPQLSFGKSLILSTIMRLGICVIPMLSQVLRENKPLSRFAINTAHYFVIILLSTCLLKIM